MTVRRLRPDDAAGIVDCIDRVYGSTYANEAFHDASQLSRSMREGSLCSVGALRDDSRLQKRSNLENVRIGRATGRASPWTGTGTYEYAIREHVQSRMQRPGWNGGE